MNIDLEVEPSPVPDRKDESSQPGLGLAAERSQEPERTGHRREHDAREPRREFTDRVDGVVQDAAAFRAVAFADLVTQQFDGHPYAARRGIAEAERAGWIERVEGTGPNGGTFAVVVATPAGVERARIVWARAGREDQRGWSGVVKASDLDHDCAVYRAACDAAERIEAEGGRVERVRVDAELKGTVAAGTERVRHAEGREAADTARRRLAAELELPVSEDGKVLFPDAQIEYTDAEGRAGRASVEVASQHYSGATVRAKAAAGFQMYAAAGGAADFVRRALAAGGGSSGSRRGGRSGGSRDMNEVFEI